MKQKNITVLVVEDEVLIGLMLAKKLRSLGYLVPDVVTTGERAVETAARDRPTVVLMDVTLAGDMNGLEAARQIRNEYGIPIIIFTGYNDSLLHEQARQVSPVAVLAKMSPLSDIVAAIEKAANISS